MTQLSPSILSANFCHLEADCRKVMDAGADMLHFDVMDGQFVPNISFGVPVLECLHKNMPDLFYDVHLMIINPKKYIGAFAKAGASLITIHLECDDPVEETIDAIHAAGCKAGLSIKPATPAEAVLPLLDKLDLVLVMGVEPGFGGQKFMPVALDKLRFLKAECAKRGVSPWLQVDGGVNASTAPEIVAAGCNLLVAGSAVFNASDPAEAVRSLRAL